MILGHNGMLGHMVKKYLLDQKCNITINCRYPSLEFESNIVNYKGDFIINCIGSIPQRTTNFKVNTDLPIWLSNNAPCKVIHPGTDCEMDSDSYGISKRLASEYIQLYSSNTKILKTSIIGPELNSNSSLMEWFLSQEIEVNGYTEAIWNGNTTLEWAKQCFELMNHWDDYQIENTIQGHPISKYFLLNAIKEIFNKNITIKPIQLGKDKCLNGNIKTAPIKDQLKQLKDYYYATI